MLNKIIFSIFISIAIIFPLKGQSVKLDSTFNGTGKILFKDLPYGMPTQPILYPNGDILFFGIEENKNANTLVKLNRSGEFADDFGVNGRLDFQEDLMEPYIIGMGLQSTKKILIAGDYYDDKGKDCIFISRILPNGQNDITFGDEGRVLIEKVDTSIVVTSILVLKNDDILISGALELNGSTKAYLLKLKSDGSVDPSFDQDGLMIPKLNIYDAFSSVKIDSNDKIVASGTIGSFTVDFLIARFNQDGSLDKSFNDSGYNVINFKANSVSEAFNFDFDSENRIVLVGYYLEGGSDFTIISSARVNDNGTIDENYGDGGILISKVGPTGFARNVKVLPDNSIIIFGEASIKEVNTDYDFLLIHLDEYGKPIETFGNDGLFFIDMGYKVDSPLFMEMNGRELYLGGISDNLYNEPGATGIAKLILDNSAATNSLENDIDASVNPSIISSEFNILINTTFAGKYSIDIFDSKGMKVSTLIHAEFLKQGKFSKTFQSTNLKSGLYYIKIQSDEALKTLKFIKI